MSAEALRLANTSAGPTRWPSGIPAVCGLAVITGALLDSVPVVALALVPLAIWVVIYAPETLLVLLAAQGTLKAVPPFSSIPVNMLLVALGLLGVACVLQIHKRGLPLLRTPAVLMILLAVFLLVAVVHTSSIPGGTYKAVYFEAVCVTLFFAPMVLVRDGAGLARLATGFVVIGLVVAHVATPGSSPGEPYTLPGGSEITAAYFPAVGALAALSCLAMRALGVRRVILVAVAVVLTAAAVRAGSRGVLIAILLAMSLALVLLVIHSRNPIPAFALAMVVVACGVTGANAVIGQSALQRYSSLTSDARREYLRNHALDQALNHPLGAGVGAYGVNLPVLSPRPSVAYPHNILLEVFNESGLLALDVLIALVAGAFIMALRLARRPGFAFCAVGIVFALVEALASGSVNDQGVLWLMLGLTLAATVMPEVRCRGGPAVP